MICSCCEVTFLESCTRLLIYFLSFNLGTEVLQSLKSCKMGLRFWYVINITPVKLLLLNAEYIASKDFIQGWKVLYLVFTGILASYGKDGLELASSCTENNNVMILS
ncbi:uncharacterized protein [Coffea arabica]|uniref:Uncharacterized protein isoform X1 n=1 Tax=Coffea arabica TaxID=13443 RepID=A0ABM4VHV7_COFAR